MYGNVFVGHLGGQLVLQAVDADEDAVQLLLVGLELLEPGLTFRLPGGEFIGDSGAHKHFPTFPQLGPLPKCLTNRILFNIFSNSL